LLVFSSVVLAASAFAQPNSDFLRPPRSAAYNLDGLSPDLKERIQEVEFRSGLIKWSAIGLIADDYETIGEPLSVLDADLRVLFEILDDSKLALPLARNRARACQRRGSPVDDLLLIGDPSCDHCREALEVIDQAGKIDGRFPPLAVLALGAPGSTGEALAIQLSAAEDDLEYCRSFREALVLSKANASPDSLFPELKLSEARRKKEREELEHIYRELADREIELPIVVYRGHLLKRTHGTKDPGAIFDPLRSAGYLSLSLWWIDNVKQSTETP
jgi:hypothetical protein